MKFTGERFIECEATAGQPIEREHWQRYLVAAQLVKPGDTVLDIACGTGYGSHHLSGGAGRVYGVDISAEAVEYAQQTYPSDNVQFLQGSVTQIPLPDRSVDLIVSFETIEHVVEEEQHAFLREANRILRPGGRLIVSCPNKPIASDLPYELWGYVNPFHKKEYDQPGFRALLEQYFKAVSFLYQRNELTLIMDAPGAKTLDIQWGERKDHRDTQNLIAICGAEPVDPLPLSCIIPDIDGLYLQEQRTLSQYSKMVEAQAADMERLIAQAHSLEGAIAQKQAEADGHAAYIRELHAAITMKDADTQRLIHQAQALEGAIAQKQAEADGHAAYISELLNAITTKDADTQRLIHQAQSLEEAIAQKQMEADGHAAYIRELQAAITTKDADTQRLILQAQALEGAIAQKQAEADGHAAYIGELQTAISSKDRDIAVLTAQLHILELSIAQNLQKLESCHQVLADRNAYVDILENRLTCRNELIDQLQLASAAQTVRISELETIEQSTIWRVTAPFRHFLDWAKHLFRQI